MSRSRKIPAAATHIGRQPRNDHGSIKLPDGYDEIAWSPDRSTVACRHRSGLWLCATAKPALQLAFAWPRGAGYTHARWSPAGRFVAGYGSVQDPGAGDQWFVIVYDTVERQHVSADRPLITHTTVQWSADGLDLRANERVGDDEYRTVIIDPVSGRTVVDELE